MGFRTSRALRFGGLLLVAGCNCSRLGGEVDSFAFTRCAEREPPRERSLQSGALSLRVEGRTLSIETGGELRVSAFTGPVGTAFARSDIAQLAASRANLLLYLGGLGDTVEVASANLSALAALRVPTLFIPGGADRLPLVEEAFLQLDDQSAEYMVHASGLREVRLGKERFAVLPGAAMGRYAIDEASCGFEQADLDALAEVFGDGEQGHSWLLGWNAPAGWGMTHGAGGQDVGSEELAKLAASIGVRGGLFAYPEVQVLEPGRGPKSTGLALVVPRLGRTGAQRANGGRVPASVATLVVTSQGLSPAP